MAAPEEKTESPKAQANAGQSKNIVLFADGTGNAFSTQESNVWRLYQALEKSQGDQIARYIKGVGTSGFRPYAMLDGATGIGVPSNVRKLYEFICWNWNREDKICMFGFSRGSFTIRTLIGLIDHEGLVPCKIGEEMVSRHQMRRNVMAAWRSYRSKTAPNSLLRVSPLIPLTRFIRNLFVGFYHWVLQHPTYKQITQQTELQGRSRTPIKFVGLFDTVEAFGVPIGEFRRAIDWAIWPISFTNTRLSDLVGRACHALSLDDERRTFHPIRFDVSQETPDQKKSNRIQEVWFAGVHSDVGGGYPDADLEHVPLVWMAEQAARIGELRFTNGAIQAFREAASPLGPRHDSRDGLGVFYRYGPRIIKDEGSEGGPPVIHHSVAERMVFGSDGYAPIVLPGTAWVLLPDGSKQKIHGFEPEKVRRLAPPPPELQRALDAVHAIRNPDQYIVSLVRDRVWWRRVAYFALLAAVILALSMPWTTDYIMAFAGGAANRTSDAAGTGLSWKHIWEGLSSAGGSITAVLASVLAIVGSFIPGYAKPWIDVLSKQPIACLVVVAAVAVLYAMNSYLRDRIADLARQAWFPSRRERGLRQGETPDKSKKTFAWFMRTSGLTNIVQKMFADFLLPGVGIVAIYLAAFVAVDRSLVNVYEGHGNACRGSRNPTPLGVGYGQPLDAR